MESATELATKSADSFLQQGTLGATVVALALALVALLIVGWRALDRKDKRIGELEEGWRNDLRTTLGSVTTALGTVDRAIDTLERVEAAKTRSR